MNLIMTTKQKLCYQGNLGFPFVINIANLAIVDSILGDYVHTIIRERYVSNSEMKESASGMDVNSDIPLKVV